MNATFPTGFGITHVTLAQTIALVPSSVMTALVNPGRYAVLLIAALIVATLWDAVFALVRKSALSLHGITTALIVVILIPPDLLFWQLAFALSLGVVLGELVFGGRGFGFLSPAVVTVSLVMFSFPNVDLAAGTIPTAVATVPGAMFLLYLGIISWRVVVSVAIGVVALLVAFGQTVDATIIAASLTFCLIFLICDPTVAAATNPGRWMYGLLTGALVVLFSDGQTLSGEAIIFAALIASIFAPLIDHLVILAHSKRWKTAHD